MTRALFTLAICAVLSSTAGCNNRPPSDGQDDGICDPAAPECPEDMVCDPIGDGTARCAAPITLQGFVLDLVTEAPIEGAIVQAVDVNGAAVGTTGVTDALGAYTLTVPAVRDVDGTPVDGSYTLRAQAATYQEFPTAIRPALPIDVSSALNEEEGWILESPLTTVLLLPLPGDPSQLATISGTVSAERNAGLLIVAEGAGGAFVGFTDSEGSYTIFNVAAGSYAVKCYAAGVQCTPANASVLAGETLEDVDLTGEDRPLSTVSGNVQIVNAPGGSQTSVVLAVESTFVEAAARGTVPPGLRVGQVSGAFTISDVPDGRYVVLAAFENDGLVRDPDQTIGGTRIVRIEVPDPVMGNAVVLPEGFKVTGALAVVAPGSEGPEPVDSFTPTFEWADDSSEDGYEVRVFDAFGNEVWSDEIGPISGSATVSHTYAGPGLAAGMIYQFRATSFRERTEVRTAISTTEDLKGVFIAPGAF